MIEQTHEIIRPHIRRTPTAHLDARELGLPHGDIQLKLELLQHSGSFKARGAFANLLTRDIPTAGVIAASGGNHGAAVAYAAHKLGIPATIFVPRISSAAKVARIRSYGAELVIGGDGYSDALLASEERARERVRCACMHSTRKRRCSARARSVANSRNRPRILIQY